MILIDKNFVEENPAKLAETIVEQVMSYADYNKPYICIAVDSNVQKNKVMRSDESYAVNDCLLKPIFKEALDIILTNSGIIHWKFFIWDLN